MKTFKLTKGIQIILITLLVIVVGAIIVGIVSNDKAMALSCTANCGSGYVVLNGVYDSNYHYYKCGECGADAGGESHSFVASTESMGDEKHGWYYQCKSCNFGKDRYYTTGVCSDGNSDEVCDYCGGWTDNTGGSGSSGGSGGTSGSTCNECTSYVEEYRKKDDVLHSCYRVCTVCGNTWYDADYIHKYEVYTDNGNGTHTANCKKDCGHSITEEHNFENGVCAECGAEEECNHVEKIIPAVAATCTTAGSTAGKKCSVCGEVLQAPTTIAPLGHTEVDIEPVDATCTTAGSTGGKKCSVCNTVTEEPTTIAALGHTEVDIEAVEATCTTAGSTAGKKCSVCNTVTQEPTEVPATGHTEVDIEAVEATCTTAGRTAGKKCSVCDTITKKPTTIAALGHKSVTIPAVEATCTTEGKTEGTRCSRCNTTLVAQTTVAALGHNYENGKCTQCGQEEPIEKIEITSTKYKIEGTYIYIQPSTKISDFKSNITTNATEINVYNNNEKVSNDETIATGMTIELKNGDKIQTFAIIVKGDVNGDGLADFKDLVKINKARLNKITFDEIYFHAADINEDESIDLKDLSKINRFRLNKITEL